MSRTEGEIAYSGQLFQILHHPIEGRARPYEIVHRIGSTTVLPILYDRHGRASVLTIENTRPHYGTSQELPGGNENYFLQPGDTGPTTVPNPLCTGLKELHEETGYVQDDPGVLPELYRLKNSSSTIVYDRHLLVVRGLLYVAGEAKNPREQITLRPTAIKDYLEPIFELERPELQPEISIALARAAMQHGRDAVLGWLETGEGVEHIQKSFFPDLEAVDISGA